MESANHHLKFNSAMSNIFLLIFLGFFILSSQVQAHTFYVGGEDGWVLNPKEDYSHWASRNRFQINDTLIFKYKKGHDTVLVVDKEDFDSCNKEKPLLALKDGVSEFKFDRSGYFFFISGHASNCANGQKLITFVMHPRNPPPAPASDSAAPAPAPVDVMDSPAPAPDESCAAIFDGQVYGFVIASLWLCSLQLVI